MSDFFSFEIESEQTVFYAAEELTKIGRGGLSLRQVGSNLHARAMMILQETYDFGADTGRAMYGHELEEAGVVISGGVEVTVGDQRKVLGPAMPITSTVARRTGSGRSAPKSAGSSAPAHRQLSEHLE
ncbi:cupin domain-containing protein [Ruegeria conchae]|uniref:cupin domain-containing protein n=1 Tax=Ruegeria conchae TaxID=981384 RepID=UPI000237A69E|nr:cupin domain-containing protein [Ruegeria conchae]